MVTASDLLGRVLHRLGAGGEHWTQGANARNVRGEWVSSWSPAAAAWCPTGALQREVAALGDDLPASVACAALHRLQRTCGADSVQDWNDRVTSFGEVQVVLRSAMEGPK